MKFRVPVYLSGRARWLVFLQFISFGAVLMGVKLWVIGGYGNPTPFWDQWDAEAANLYKPFFSHTLSVSDLFSPHNEHRIFTTRLLALALLKLNSIWNPMLQMVVNACLHVITLMLGVSLLTKVTGRTHLPAMLVFSVVLFAIPYGWENTLAGFQSQFYFVVLFSIASLWLTTVKEPLSFGWWGGAACGVLAFFSLASGVFTLGAAAFISFIVFITNLRRTPKQLTAVTILGILFLTGLKQTPSIPGHAVFKAVSFGQFYNALNGCLGWPISSGFFSALIRNLPAFIFVVVMLRKPPRAGDPRWFLMALIVWAFGQAFSLAYGRATIYLASRYLDLFAVTVLINFACLLSIIETNFNKWRNRSLALAGVWAVILLLSVSRKGILLLPVDLTAKREGSIVQEQNTRNYLQTGDTSYIKKPLLQIPYPDADRFAMILSWPEIRNILPSEINPGLKPVLVGKNPADVFGKNGYYPATSGYSDTAWGSYNAQGDLGTGQLSLDFDPGMPVGKIIIPVAGYPLNEGMKLEIRQNNKRIPVPVANNPKESWSIAEVNVKKGPFSIYATDSSKTTWLAIGKPVLVGRLDGLTNRALSHYYVFLLLGIMIFVFLVITGSFKNKTTTASESSEGGL